MSSNAIRVPEYQEGEYTILRGEWGYYHGLRWAVILKDEIVGDFKTLKAARRFCGQHRRWLVQQKEHTATPVCKLTGDVHTGKHARRWLRAGKILRKAMLRVSVAEHKGTTLGDAMGVLAEVIQEQGS